MQYDNAPESLVYIVRTIRIELGVSSKVWNLVLDDKGNMLSIVLALSIKCILGC